MKKTFLLFALLSMSLLTACSVPFKKEKEEEVTYALEAVTADKLNEDMFYVKTGDQFYPVHMGETNIGAENLIAKQSDPNRIISFTKDDCMVPVMYKDDTMIYYTSKSVPSFTWERMKDYGYTVGLYNLGTAESGKIEFIVGESRTDHNSAAYAGLSKIDIGNSVVVVDKVGGQSLSGDRLSECGSINGLKADELANIDIYVGTQHYTIESMVDTHVLSSMELYQTNEYNLLPEGYASVKIPDYFLSGYYFINGVGVVKYVNNNRSEGIPNIDFSIPYYYKDKNGKQITIEEWNKLNGNTDVNEVKDADYEFSYDIDSTVKAFKMTLKYDLLEGENPDDILYTAPSAVIVSPTGEKTEFTPGTEDGKRTLYADIDGVVSGPWEIQIYDLGERKFNIASSIETGNADSFVHSGNNSGKFTIHSDGVSGLALATVTWENATHAAKVEIKSPLGVKYNDTENRDMMVEDGYGKKTMLLDGAEAGEWELTISGENLGRCWFNITKSENNVRMESAAETEAETEAAAKTESISETESESSEEVRAEVTETEESAEVQEESEQGE